MLGGFSCSLPHLHLPSSKKGRTAESLFQALVYVPSVLLITVPKTSHILSLFLSGTGFPRVFPRRPAPRSSVNPQMAQRTGLPWLQAPQYTDRLGFEKASWGSAGGRATPSGGPLGTKVIPWREEGFRVKQRFLGGCI